MPPRSSTQWRNSANTTAIQTGAFPPRNSSRNSNQSRRVPAGRKRGRVPKDSLTPFAVKRAATQVRRDLVVSFVVRQCRQEKASGSTTGCPKDVRQCRRERATVRRTGCPRDVRQCRQEKASGSTTGWMKDARQCRQEKASGSTTGCMKDARRCKDRSKISLRGVLDRKATLVVASSASSSNSDHKMTVALVRWSLSSSRGAAFGAQSNHFHRRTVGQDRSSETLKVASIPRRGHNKGGLPETIRLGILGSRFKSAGFSPKRQRDLWRFALYG